jgi:hypothetical protein
MMTIIRTFYGKYRNVLQFNKNRIVSVIVAFSVSAAVTEQYSKYDNNDVLISTVGTLTGFSVSIIILPFCST